MDGLVVRKPVSPDLFAVLFIFVPFSVFLALVVWLEGWAWMQPWALVLKILVILGVGALFPAWTLLRVRSKNNEAASESHGLTRSPNIMVLLVVLAMMPIGQFRWAVTRSDVIQDALRHEGAADLAYCKVERSHWSTRTYRCSGKAVRRYAEIIHPASQS